MTRPTSDDRALPALQHRLEAVTTRLRLLLLRRAGLRTTLHEYDHAYARAAAGLRLQIGQAVTAAGTPLYPTEAAQQAALTLAVDNDLALHALTALIAHTQRRLEVADAELAAVRAERADLRALLRALPRAAEPHAPGNPADAVPAPTASAATDATAQRCERQRRRTAAGERPAQQHPATDQGRAGDAR